jgi:hypothetical protein
MAPSSYLRQVATRQAAGLGRTTLAPQRILFRPILQHTGSLEAPSTPVGYPIARRTLEADTAISAQLARGAELPMSPARPQRQRRHLEPAAPGRASASPIVVARPAEQEILDAPASGQAPEPNSLSGSSPTRPISARDPAVATSPIRDAEVPNPEPARNATGFVGFAARRVSSASNAGRDRRPVFAREQPTSQAPSPSMFHDSRQEPGYSHASHEAAESEAARGERIRLTPSLDRSRRETSNATAGSESSRGGVHIGSLEVHVSAPPVTADAPQAPFLPQPCNGSARAPLVRGFPGFGLVQS